jgi:hypothetical protein
VQKVTAEQEQLAKEKAERNSLHAEYAERVNKALKLSSLNMTGLNLNSELPLSLVEGTDDDLGLGFNLAGFEAYVATMICDENFLVTDDLVGQPIPKTAAQAKKMLKKLEAKGGDFVDKFKAPVVCRVLKDEDIDWAAEGTGGRRLFCLVDTRLTGKACALPVRQFSDFDKVLYHGHTKSNHSCVPLIPSPW